MIWPTNWMLSGRICVRIIRGKRDSFSGNVLGGRVMDEEFKTEALRLLEDILEELKLLRREVADQLVMSIEDILSNPENVVIS